MKIPKQIFYNSHKLHPNFYSYEEYTITKSIIETIGFIVDEDNALYNIEGDPVMVKGYQVHFPINDYWEFNKCSNLFRPATDFIHNTILINVFAEANPHLNIYSYEFEESIKQPGKFDGYFIDMYSNEIKNSKVFELDDDLALAMLSIMKLLDLNDNGTFVNMCRVSKISSKRKKRGKQRR